MTGLRCPILNDYQRVARVGLASEMDVVAWSQNLTPERAAAVGVRLASQAYLAGAPVRVVSP